MGNFAFDLASYRTEQERDAGIARARAALKAEGEVCCVGCGDEIETARRIAFPAARRCIECQTHIERKRR